MLRCLFRNPAAGLRTIKDRFFRPSFRDRFQVGARTYGEPEVYFRDQARLVVGAYVSISAKVTILVGGEHRMDWISSFPFPAFDPDLSDVRDYQRSKGDVVIGNDVWIGYGATILSGVTIGDGAVIGACAVVTKDVPPYGIAAGNPARLVRYRFSSGEIEQLLRLRWWDWEPARIRRARRLLMSSDIAGLVEFARATGPAADLQNPDP